MTEDVPLMPEFALAMRGYDRVQVDDYVARYARRALEMRARTEAAEQAAAAARGEVDDLRRRLESGEERDGADTPPAIQALGERVGRILQVAWESSEEMRREAELGSTTMVSDAQTKATELLEGAERQVVELTAEADRTLAQARAQAQAVMEEAEERAAGDADLRAAESDRHREVLQAEIDALEARRVATMSGLDRLRSVLEGALQAPTPSEQTDPSGASPDASRPPSDETTIIRPSDLHLNTELAETEPAASESAVDESPGDAASVDLRTVPARSRARVV